MTFTDVLAAIQHSWIYWLAIVYFAAYPMVTSVMWITTAMFFRSRWEKHAAPPLLTRRPSVSVLIPAHNEERVIANVIAATAAINCPDFEVVVVMTAPPTRRDVIGPYVATAGAADRQAIERRQCGAGDALLPQW
jgi:biofilm PGA synthesis N-glycosyltransferase PgaC